MYLPATNTLGFSTNGTLAAVIDANQNLGIGTTSPNARITVKAAGNSYTNGALALVGSVSGTSYISGIGGSLYFSNNGSTDHMVLDSSGNLLVGTTTAGAGVGFTTKVAVDAGSGYGPLFRGGASGASYECMDCWNIATTGNNVFMNFYTEASSTGRGSITYNRAGGLTAYNTTSDYRAKTVNGPVQNVLSKLAALKPSTGRMNGAEYDIDFFVAHELQEVVPSAVTGEKDATREEQYEATPAVKDEDGKVITEAVMETRVVPIYQMVDKSALIPLLTAALQEQQALITQLQADVAALKG